MKHFGFAIENNVGNATYRQNLAGVINTYPDVAADFLPIDLVADDLWSRIPLVRSNLALVASARAASALQRCHRARRLDAALIHSQSISLFSMRVMAKVPTVISTDATPANFDTLNAGYNAVVRQRSIESLKLKWTKVTFRRAARLLAWSDWVKDSYVNDYGVPAEKILTLHPGLDVDLWKPDRDARPSGGPVRILFVSGDFKRKGGDILLRWLEKTRYRDDVEVHMVSKEQLPDVPGVVPHYGLTANSEGLIRLTQSCDLFAFPTRADCSPWVLVEAQAAGLPGVSTDVGAIREIVQDGVTGFLAPAGNEIEFFDRLDALVEDSGQRRAMSEAARSRAVERFDITKSSARLVDLMSTMAGAGEHARP